MGYKPGSGLGKDGVGIVNPIDVKLRPQKMGIGHKGFDERTNTVKLEQAMKRAELAKVSVDQWKRGNKKKVSHKTADELLKEQQDTLAPAAATGRKTKIIDMTGAQARELENMAEATSVSRIAALKEAASHLVELRYNVKVIEKLNEMGWKRSPVAIPSQVCKVGLSDGQEEFSQSVKLTIQIQTRDEVKTTQEGQSDRQFISDTR
ncbi:hypothetical protein HDU80_001030 [Chytriomyces hyalinus]|nr:hypothetical protein HDU80_001030 [Chytriomyces hyalinus]